jgi:Fe-S oxidoreductase
VADLTVRTFAELLDEAGWTPPREERRAIGQIHCHQHAELGADADLRLLAQAGVEVEVPDSGCCGLAGNFGFERGHYDVSVSVAERVLAPAVRAADPDTIVLADGFSCRTQIEQLTGRHAVHLAEVLMPENLEDVRMVRDPGARHGTM